MFALKSTPYNKQEIITQGFLLFRQAFWRVFPYSLIASLCIFAPQLFTFEVIKISHYAPILVEILSCWIMGLIFISALIFRLYCFSNHIPSHFWHTLRHALIKLIPLLMVSVLYGLVILSGTLLLVIPGIILAISLMFAFVLLIIGNQNILQTLVMSHRFVWGNWWHTFFVISMPLLLDLAISLLIFILIAVIAINTHITSFALYTLTFFLNVLIQSIFIPFIYSVVLILLHDLRCRYFSSLPQWQI